MERIEMREGIFQGMTKEAKRYVLSFGEGEDLPRRYSAFEPLQQLAELVMGEKYSYEVEHVPTKEEGKFYHNLTRTGRDAPFKIHSLGKPQVQANLNQPIKEQKPYTPQPGRKDVDSRESYWAEREKRDIEKEKIYELRLPYINAVNMMPGACAIVAGMMNHAQGYEEVKRNGIDNTIEAILRQMEAIVQQRLPLEAAYKRTEKKAPLEAEV